MLNAPINVISNCDELTSLTCWTQKEKQNWIGLNKEVGGNPYFLPLTIKVAYVIGVNYLTVKSVVCLTNHPEGNETTYVSRYLLLATCIELLGRCTTGENDPKKPTLGSGLKWLFSETDEDISVLKTRQANYCIKELSAMRNFSAHGQGVSEVRQNNQTIIISSKFALPDEELLHELQLKLGERLNNYWVTLVNEPNDTFSWREQLAKARVDPINSKRILKAWEEFQQQPSRDVAQVFREIKCVKA